MALTTEDLQAIAALLQPIKDDIQTLKGDVRTLKDEVQTLKDEVQTLKDEVQTLKKDVRDLKQRVEGIGIHLENVTDRNIQTVAEGHLDLSRKLDDALKVENEKELLIIRVRMLEDEVRKIKEQLGQIA